jgi:CHAD domain-containing protein
MSSVREREDKYEVPPGFSVTEGLRPLVVDGVRVAQREQVLDNAYFDTADRALLRHRVTLRRRRGETENGWQVKLPAGRARTEIHRGDASDDEIPGPLAEVVSGIVRGRPLAEVARLRTHRVTHRLLGRDEAPLVELADDTVHAAVGDLTHEWREVEVELGESGDEKLLAFVGKRLRRTGARPSPYPSKLARVLPSDGRPNHEPLSAYLRKQYDRLITEDVRLRRGQGDVHDARVAIRRLRSTLRTFRPLFEPGSTRSLDAELRWFGGLLGEVRDREVLRRHLDGALDALPAAMILGPVRARVDEHLLSEAVRHQMDVDAALRSERYLTLLDRLERFGQELPLRDEPTRKKLRKRADKAARKAMRRVDRALDADPDAMGGALHQARKQAKRARYAAELVRPITGRPAKKQARRFEKLQDILGEHQDSVVTSALLHDLGRRAGSTAGENGFTYGLLLCREQQRGVVAREQARRWRRLQPG